MKKRIADNQTPKDLADQLRGANALKTLFDLVPFGNRMFPGMASALEGLPSMEAVAEIVNLPDRFNDAFSEQGWIAYEALSVDTMRLALAAKDEGGQLAAERVLADSYDEDALRFGIMRLTGHAEFRRRVRLVELARDDYLAGRYHACIPLLLALLDGLVNDVSKHVGFFAGAADMTAWDSIAAHETGLANLAKIMGLGRNKTNENEISVPFRNGILHGRELAFDNKIVAAKCWAALFAVRDWAGALAEGKKDPKPKEQATFAELAQKLAETAKERKAMEAWQPRDGKELSYFPCSGPPESLPDNTPERVAAEFLDNWCRSRFAPMAEALVDYVNSPIGKKAGNARRDFGRRIPTAYQIIGVTDEAAAISKVEAELTFQLEGGAKSFRISVGHIYYDAENQPLVRGHPAGAWKIYQNSFSELIYGG